MHIKEVNVTGFRSYREATAIDSFSPRHNVIVGRNGSGKSNFFYAIQFVLSDEFSTLKADQRMSILHEGAGQKSTSARVEIVFDNSDRRIPAAEATEVRVIRQVGQKKDQYFIDGKVVLRAEVVNLMESAGFSRSNPYYIVKQGKINELATAADHYRLKLLREVAGTRVYDERKDESMKILNETQQKTQKIEDLLKFIEDRLRDLEEEKKDLKEYQKWDKTKRSIEYTICDTDINETRRKMERFSDQREEINQRQHQVNAQLIEVQASEARTTTEQRKLENKFKGFKEEKETLQMEQAEKYRKKTELELQITDLRQDVDVERNSRHKSEEELKKLKEEIGDKEDELEQINPEFHKAQEDEIGLLSDVRIAEARMKELLAKQGHKEQFKTVTERDNHLRNLIRSVGRQIEEELNRKREAEQDIETDVKEEDDKNKKIGEIGAKIHTVHSQIDRASAEMSKLKQEQDKAVVAQLDATGEERAVRDSLNALNAEISTLDHSLHTVVARPTMQGAENVRKVIQWFKDHNDHGRYDDIIQGYHGTVMELFECDPAYFQAVEVTCGNRLFNHIVSDDRVATKILEQVNRQNLHGECNFFPINRMASSRKKQTQNTEDARPMIDILDYDPIYEPVFLNIFGSVAIVRSMQVGSVVARNEGFDCVTLEGDQVSRRGALTGGYIDAKRNKMEIHHNMTNLMNQRTELQLTLDEMQRKVNEKLATVQKIRGNIEKLDSQMRSLKDTHRNLSAEKQAVSEELQTVLRRKEPNNARLLESKNKLRELDAQKSTYEGEIGSDLQSQLTKDEQKESDGLQVEIREKRQEVQKIAKKRADLQNKKLKLENQLQTNLYRKREALQATINDIAVDEKRHNLQSETSDLSSVQMRLAEIKKRLTELDGHLQEYDEEREKLTREQEDVAEQKKDLETQAGELCKQLDQISTKLSSLATKREESLKKIRDLGSLPTEAFARYQGMSAKQLEKKLSECLNELKKYENVNKRALDQFVAASSQKEDLTKRKEEQEKSEQSIKDLLEVMENRKYEAIQLTFKQVSKNFAEVFEKLVPTGTGKLVVQMAGNSQESMDESASQELHMVERYSGIGIKVSFNGTSETREMQQLSGGQKSLVALALIFAIQMCDPAPFYLFDEIDAALDAQHRKAVADMIHELSQNAQFITTTFRPELLEHAEKYYGVKFRNKVSHIDMVTKDQAYDFVEDDQTHG